LFCCVRCCYCCCCAVYGCCCGGGGGGGVLGWLVFVDCFVLFLELLLMFVFGGIEEFD
jgi:hypothetical protein